MGLVPGVKRINTPLTVYVVALALLFPIFIYIDSIVESPALR
jgi:hypothetical protein